MAGVLERLFPGVAANRAEKRARIAAANARAAAMEKLQGDLRKRDAFKAADTNRLNSHYRRWSGDLNTLLLSQLRTLRDKSRWLCANNPYAASAIGILQNYVVGTGMQPQAAVRTVTKEGDQVRIEEKDNWNDYVDDLWARWSRNVDIGCGKGEPSSFWEMQCIVLRRLFEDGEVFIRTTNPKKWPVVPFASEILMPEWLDEMVSKNDATGNQIIAGIEVDAYGRKVAYHFRRARGDGTANVASKTIRIPAEEMIHLYVRRQPRQLRGIPMMASVLERFYSLDEYADFELISAKIAACFGAFITRPAGDSGDVLQKGDGSVEVKDAEGNILSTVEPGMIANLPEGYGVTFAQPQKPGATFDMFTTFNLRSLGAGIEGGLSYESLTRDTSRSTFAGGRLSQIMDYQTFRGMQKFLEERFGVPYRDRWLEAAIASGAVTAPGYFGDQRDYWSRCDFIQSGWSWGINPLQEVNAARESMRAGITTLADECSYLGRSWKQQLRLQAKINREANLLGVQLSGNPAHDNLPDENNPPEELPGGVGDDPQEAEA